MFNTPILLLIFNRPDTTRIVFDKLREIKPKFLYVAADGPRDSKLDEDKKCQLTRDIILEGVDWDCDIKTLFQENNLGCGKGVSTAITWFFEQVDYGIILEDDILPDNSFFPFCEELLIRYQNDSNIMTICGFNPISNVNTDRSSYVFTNYAGVWGWASWRRAWKGYDYELIDWNKKSVRNKLKRRFRKEQYAFMHSAFNQSQNIDTWDYQWWFHRLKNKGLGILPTVNLIKNIGFNEDATHTKDVNNDIESINVLKLNFPLNHQNKIKVNKQFDLTLSQKYFWQEIQKKTSILKRIINRVFRIR